MEMEKFQTATIAELAATRYVLERIGKIAFLAAGLRTDHVMSMRNRAKKATSRCSACNRALSISPLSVASQARVVTSRPAIADRSSMLADSRDRTPSGPTYHRVDPCRFSNSHLRIFVYGQVI